MLASLAQVRNQTSEFLEVSMKKLFMTMLSVLACGAVYALPVGNPADASLLCDGLFWEGHCGDPCDPCLTWCDAWSFRIGFYGDYVWNRHMEVDDHGPDIEQTELFTNAGFIAFNLYDRVDIFGTLGATNIFIDTNATAFHGGIDDRLEIETETHFSWSVGGRATLWECGCTSLGVEGQYFYTKPDVTRVTQAATASVYPGNHQVQAKYREWQVGVGIAHRINMLVPYIAVKWASSQLIFDHAIPGIGTVVLDNLESKKYFGYAVGVSLVDCEKASLTVEGRFADEKALYVNGQIRF